MPSFLCPGTQHPKCCLLCCSGLQSVSFTTQGLVKSSVWMEVHRLNLINLVLSIRAAETIHVSPRASLEDESKAMSVCQECVWALAAWLSALINLWLISGILQPAPSQASLGNDQGPLPKDKSNKVVLERHQTIVLVLQQETLKFKHHWQRNNSWCCQDFCLHLDFAICDLKARKNTQKQSKWCCKIWYGLSSTHDGKGEKKLINWYFRVTPRLG